MEMGYSKKEKRFMWASIRSVLELDSAKSKVSGKKSKSHWSTFEKILNFISFFLKTTGLYKRGQENALSLNYAPLKLSFKDLPEEFHGFKILHLSDLHIDGSANLENSIIDKITGKQFDLCVITGDYRFDTDGNYKQILEPFKRIISNINSKHGVIAILGNHDTWKITNYESSLGLRFLINESITLTKGDANITITGTDDPFKYFTSDQVDALEDTPDGFKIALVHTTELAENAAENGYNLYLCGHTHGGQICLPNEIPLITHQYEGRRFYKGTWNINGMQGVTSRGCGVSGIPIRFFSRGEVVSIELQKA